MDIEKIIQLIKKTKEHGKITNEHGCNYNSLEMEAEDLQIPLYEYLLIDHKYGHEDGFMHIDLLKEDLLVINPTFITCAKDEHYTGGNVCDINLKNYDQGAYFTFHIKALNSYFDNKDVKEVSNSKIESAVRELFQKAIKENVQEGIDYFCEIVNKGGVQENIHDVMMHALHNPTDYGICTEGHLDTLLRGIDYVYKNCEESIDYSGIKHKEHSPHYLSHNKTITESIKYYEDLYKENSKYSYSHIDNASEKLKALIQGHEDSLDIYE